MAVSWRWLIDHPAEQLIVFHDSLLPRYRGFEPLVTSLVNGETRIGVAALFGASEFDTGDVIVQSATASRIPSRLPRRSRSSTSTTSSARWRSARLAKVEPLTARPESQGDASCGV
jgi:methionyl-tRNA formyltransferase